MSTRFRLHIVRAGSPPQSPLLAGRPLRPPVPQSFIAIPGTGQPRRSVTFEALLAYTQTLLSSYKKRVVAP